MLGGCVTAPTPHQVARTCVRDEVSIAAHVHGNVHNYREEVRTRCYDDGVHHTLADSDYRLTDTRTSEAARYDDKTGDNRTRIETTTSRGKGGYRREEMVLKETKGLRWGWHTTVSTR